jgi:acetoin utilization deacetylase AcuC-like enzyme
MFLLCSPRFADHVTPPGHPERPERAHVFDAVAARWIDRNVRTAELRPATREELELVHDTRYVDDLRATAGRATILDPDTFTSPQSYDVSLLAAGAAVQAAEHAWNTGEPACALVRPPGHHAERNRAMGFCLFNNVAVAAAGMRARGCERVAIVDIDVHHGNGTQHMFYDDPSVLYVSTHQFPFYPGTGAVDEIGAGDGRGFTVNVPMEAGCGDNDYELVYRTIVGPVLEEFKPQLTLVSAGYDAHERDPLASMRVTTTGYGNIVRAVRDAANGAVALVVEGGYELNALGACLDTSLEVLDGGAMPRAEGTRENRPRDGAARGERAAIAARAVLKPFWRAL